MAELSSFLERNGFDSSVAESIGKMGLVVHLDKDIAINAGKLHASIRKKNKHVSLADCIISETAHKYNAIVITTDHHFGLLGNAIILDE